MISRLRVVPVTLFIIVASVYLGYVAYPMWKMVEGSLVVDGAFSTHHYVSLLDFSNTANREAIWNSVYVSILSVVAGGFIGVLLAFTFTQLDFPFRSILSKVAILPIALPPLVGVIAFLFVFGESGFIPRALQRVLGTVTVPFYLDGINAIVAVHVYSFYVYFYLFVSSGLTRIDASTIEASSTLGGGGWRTFRRVVLPELRPAIVGAAALTFMASMASFSAPFLFGGANRFLTTQIYNAKLNGDLELAAAQSFLLALLSLAFFAVLRWSSPPGTTRSATKGAGRYATLPVPPLIRSLLIVSSLLVLVVVLLPIATIVLISFAAEGSWTWQLFPTAFTPDNYGLLFTDPHIFAPLKNSLVMGVITVIASLLIGVPSAFYIIKGAQGRVRLLVDGLLTSPFAIPGTVIGIALIVAFQYPGVLTGGQVLVGTFWILPLAYFIRMYPLVIRSAAASLERVDDSLLEASRVFGAGSLTTFRRVVLPLILPGVIAGALLVMIAALGEFVSSILLFTYSSRPVSIEILSQLRMYNFGAAAGYSVLLLVVIAALTGAARFMGRRDEGTQGTVGL
jgi:iron(III) transport system permease protein